MSTSVHPAPSTLAEPLRRIVAKAGELIMELYEQGCEVHYKGPADPVTLADQVANDFICRELHRDFPGVPVVAEESDPSTFLGVADAPEAFFVDPLDGTREFIAKSDEFVVMIGLAVAGRASTGVIFAPATQTYWWGEEGKGAWMQVGKGRVESIRPTQRQTLAEATLVASRSSNRLGAERASSLLGIGKIQSLGSAGLKGASVASGRADIYLSPKFAGKRWDACPIDALVHAAGAVLTDTKGCRLDYRRPKGATGSGLLAANPRLHGLVLERLESLARE